MNIVVVEVVVVIVNQVRLLRYCERILQLYGGGGGGGGDSTLGGGSGPKGSTIDLQR